jgi:hypothetical protein
VLVDFFFDKYSEIVKKERRGKEKRQKHKRATLHSNIMRTKSIMTRINTMVIPIIATRTSTSALKIGQ